MLANDMIIIVYSGTGEGTVNDDLGKADYSYYFILEKYLPILHELGQVRFVKDPQREVDEIYTEALAQGITAIFLSFSPPHNTARSLRCPTVCVMAWEFASIPEDDWDSGNPALNWVSAIREIGNVITISDYATRVIRRQVGADVRVVTIPAPVDAQGASGPDHPLLRFPATLVDSRACDIGVERVTVRRTREGSPGQREAQWDRREVNWAFVSKGESAGQYLVGFYAEEDWGCWSRTSAPEIILPWHVGGDFEVELTMVGYGENQGRSIDVQIGDCTRSLKLSATMTSVTLPFSLGLEANSIHFSGLLAEPVPGARDHRTLGLGLSKLSLRPVGKVGAMPGAPAVALQPAQSTEKLAALQLDGSVYTSLFNPEDGRKNWKDIVTAFCWAFREDAGKTLLLKMSHHNKSVFMGDLLLLFSKLHPFKCRVVAIHGFLSTAHLQGMIAATDYYVNASSAEGQCLPLLEYMAEGVPAIAPDHTAMESYISAQNAFVVQSSLAPQAWPIDPRRAYRTTTQRISWDSLRQCFLDSAAVLAQDEDRYREMSEEAVRVVGERYSSDRISRDLAVFLENVVGEGE